MNEIIEHRRRFVLIRRDRLPPEGDDGLWRSDYRWGFKQWFGWGMMLGIVIVGIAGTHRLLTVYLFP